MFDDRLILIIERDGDGIEAHSRNAFVFQEPTSPQSLTCRPQATLLARGDAVERALIGTWSARAYFHDDDDVFFLNEQIDFGSSDAEVSREDSIS